MQMLFPSILPGRDADERETVTDLSGDPAAVLDSGRCPFCDDDKEYDNAHQHARMAHANAYDDAVGE